MLCIISDLHLTDGSSGETIDAGAFRLFKDALEDRVASACKREDGSFKPVDRCDLVLLGDIFDVIRSDKWLSSDFRPWHQPSDFAAVVDDITDKIIERNKESLDYIRNLKENQIKVKDPSGNEATVPLYIHYLVGNHDWFYHLPGDSFNEIRQKLVNAWGLSNDPAKPFPHLLTEADANVQSLFDKHRVYAQHGDVYDKFNFEADKGRDYSSLGDCIVIELLNQFPKAVQKELGLDADSEVAKGLREIDNVRPLLSIPGWLDGIMQRDPYKQMREGVMKVWRRMVDEFLENEFVKQQDRPWRWDTVDFLHVALGSSSIFSLSGLSRLTSIDAKVREKLNETSSYVKNALKEDVIMKNKVNYVVYGHTHKPEMIAMDVVLSNRKLEEKVYFNSGTWRRVHERCIKEIEQQEFISFHVMTYVIFYCDGERGGCRFETWTGALS